MLGPILWVSTGLLLVRSLRIHEYKRDLLKAVSLAANTNTKVHTIIRETPSFMTYFGAIVYGPILAVVTDIIEKIPIRLQFPKLEEIKYTKVSVLVSDDKIMRIYYLDNLYMLDKIYSEEELEKELLEKYLNIGENRKLGPTPFEKLRILEEKNLTPITKHEHYRVIEGQPTFEHRLDGQHLHNTSDSLPEENYPDTNLDLG